jgi:hypothetical protein
MELTKSLLLLLLKNKNHRPHWKSLGPWIRNYFLSEQMIGCNVHVCFESSIQSTRFGEKYFLQLLGVCLRRPKARTPLCVKEAKQGV